MDGGILGKKRLVFIKADKGEALFGENLRRKVPVTADDDMGEAGV